MNRKYIILYCTLIFCTVLSLISYFIISNNDIKNIVGNLFCGFFTGLLIAIISNIKSSSIYVIDNKIKNLQEIRDEIHKFFELNCEFCENEKIIILDLVEYLYDIEECFSKIRMLEIDELNNYIKTNQIDMDMGEKEIECILTELDNGEVIITCKQYRKYERRIVKILMVLTRLSKILKDELDKLIEEKNKFNKSII